MPRILITRPQDSADELAQRLTALGYQCQIEPLLKISATGSPCPPLDSVQAIMITSGNTLTMLAKTDFTRFFDYPCFCVGAQTAKKAERLGFTHVYNTLGDGLELASLITTMLTDKSRAILHISAEDYDSKACDSLKQLGFPILSWPIYRADTATALAGQTQHSLLEKNIDAVVLFSSRSAETLRYLLTKHCLVECCASVVAVGLSQNISDVLRDLPWHRQITTATPTEDAVIRCLQQQFPVQAMPDPVDPVHDKSFPVIDDTSDDMAAPPRRAGKWKSYLLTFLLALICGIIAALYAMHQYNLSQPSPALATAPVTSITASTKDDLGNITPTAPTVASKEESTPVMPPLAVSDMPKNSADTDKDDTLHRQAMDIARLQSDVVALSSSLATVQTEMKHTQDIESRMQKMAQATIGTTVDFMRLSNAANAGKPFAREISAFRMHTADNSAVQQRLSDLEPIAAQGVPSLAMLREQFIRMEPDIIRAGDYASAQTWWQRVVARLENLVVVRHARSDGKADDLTRLENELTQGDVAAVEQDVQAMPADAQTVLQPWRVKLRMRQQVDAGLSFIADQLAGRADILSPPSTQPIPSAPGNP